jgi:hypothetical protein
LNNTAVTENARVDTIDRRIWQQLGFAPKRNLIQFFIDQVVIMLGWDDGLDTCSSSGFPSDRQWLFTMNFVAQLVNQLRPDSIPAAKTNASH